MKGLFKTGLIMAVSAVVLCVLGLSTGTWGPCGPSNVWSFVAVFAGMCCGLVAAVSVVFSAPVLVVRKLREQE
jgi:hypothetical protein